MKKVFRVLTLVFGIVILNIISASADRMTELPITVVNDNGSAQVYYTITDVAIESINFSSWEKYMNDINFKIDGYFTGSAKEIPMQMLCYDAEGNYLFNYGFKIYSGRNAYQFTVPDVTASVEFVAKDPAAWSNTYYYCKYKNVYSDDGRAMGVHDLLVPVYETVGWHSDVAMWTKDGKMLAVPYCDVATYKVAGWMDETEYDIFNFRKEYGEYLGVKDYNAVMNLADSYSDYLDGTIYQDEIYVAKTYAMDQLRKAVNGPLAVVNQYVSSDGNAQIYFRNVSYKDIKAIRIQFECCDVFGRIIKSNDTYEVAKMYLPSSEATGLVFEINNRGNAGIIENIRNIKILQVVYSDGTSWYR